MMAPKRRLKTLENSGIEKNPLKILKLKRTDSKQKHYQKLKLERLILKNKVTALTISLLQESGLIREINRNGGIKCLFLPQYDNN